MEPARLNLSMLGITDCGMDASALARFYDSPIGQRTRRLIQRQLRQLWPEVRGRRMLGYGYARPYLRAFLPEAERCIAALPASLGEAAAWPRDKCLTTRSEEDALPFPDAFFDLILVVHGLEEAEGSRTELDGLLRGALFVPEHWRRALYAPPIVSRALAGSGTGWERFGGRFFPGLGGVHIAEAGKSLYAPAKIAPARAHGAPLLKPAGTE